MSFFPPIPAVLAIAALNRQKISRRPRRPQVRTVPALSAPEQEEKQPVIVAESPEVVDNAQPTQQPRRRTRTMSSMDISQAANALSDMAYYMGGGNPRAAQMAQTFKAMSMLNQPAQAQVQNSMTPQERTMGLIKSMGSLMGNSGNMPPVLNMLAGGGGPGGLLSMLGGSGGGGLGGLLSLLGGARNIAPLMSMLGGRGRKSGVQPLPANMMDRVNSMLAGMDQDKKDELLNMARSLLGNEDNTAS